MKRPVSISPPCDGIVRGARVRITWGRYAGEVGTVTDVFRRPGEAHSTVHVKGLPSSNYVVTAVPLSIVEVAP